jgi:hypothetical protein
MSNAVTFSSGGVRRWTTVSPGRIIQTALSESRKSGLDKVAASTSGVEVGGGGVTVGDRGVCVAVWLTIVLGCKVRVEAGAGVTGMVSGCRLQALSPRRKASSGPIQDILFIGRIISMKCLLHQPMNPNLQKFKPNFLYPFRA